MAKNEFEVLLLGDKGDDSQGLARSLHEASGREIQAQTMAMVHEALTRLAERGFDVVVCWADQESDLASVIRIRKSRPDLPIVVVSTREDSPFRALILQAGATCVVPPFVGAGPFSRFLLEALRSGELVRELKGHSGQVLHQDRNIRKLTQEIVAASKRLRGELRGWPRSRFEPLLVESDPEQAFLMVRAFEKSDVFAPHRVLKNGEEAMAYLSECRSRRALPSVVLLNLDLPGKSGLDVLAWIRSEKGLSKLPVVMLSAASHTPHVNRAYELGANSYLIKPTDASSLVEFVTTLKTFWCESIAPPEP